MRFAIIPPYELEELELLEDELELDDEELDDELEELIEELRLEDELLEDELLLEKLEELDEDDEEELDSPTTVRHANVGLLFAKVRQVKSVTGPPPLHSRKTV